jgi:hypothetical protein
MKKIKEKTINLTEDELPLTPSRNWYKAAIKKKLGENVVIEDFVLVGMISRFGCSTQSYNVKYSIAENKTKKFRAKKLKLAMVGLA